MSAPAPSGPTVLCLGEALVDLVGEQPVGSMSEVARFVPHFGGTVANVAVVAARAGARSALAGAAGDDRWGRWLLQRLREERVDDTHFVLTPELQTQLVFVAVDEDGEAVYELYGEPAETVVTAGGARIADAVRGAGALFLSSNTLSGAQERALTMRARALALELGRPVIFDCGLRLHRWATRADAAGASRPRQPGRGRADDRGVRS
jgi:fructokinase